jgi:hypothetical protein
MDKSSARGEAGKKNNEPLLPQDVVISRLKACQQARAVLA